MFLNRSAWILFTASIEIKLHSDYANSDSIAKIEKMVKRNSNIQDVLYRKELIDAVNDNIHLAARSRRPVDALIRPHDLYRFALIRSEAGLLVAVAVHDIYIAIVFADPVMADGFYFISSD